MCHDHVVNEASKEARAVAKLTRVASESLGVELREQSVRNFIINHWREISVCSHIIHEARNEKK